jgi:hypothetical protein
VAVGRMLLGLGCSRACFLSCTAHLRESKEQRLRKVDGGGARRMMRHGDEGTASHAVVEVGKDVELARYVQVSDKLLLPQS